MTITVRSSEWRHYRDWIRQQLADDDFDDSVLNEGDLNFIKSTDHWKHAPSEGQLGWLGGIAERVLRGAMWSYEELFDEIRRRAYRARSAKAEREKASKAVNAIGPLQKWKLYHADMVAEPDLTRADTLILWVLYDRTWADRDAAELSITDFVEATKLSRATVCRSISRLIGKYFSFRDDKNYGGRSRKNIYKQVLKLALARHPELTLTEGKAGSTRDEHATVRRQKQSHSYATETTQKQSHSYATGNLTIGTPHCSTPITCRAVAQPRPGELCDDESFGEEAGLRPTAEGLPVQFEVGPDGQRYALSIAASGAIQRSVAMHQEPEPGDRVARPPVSRIVD